MNYRLYSLTNMYLSSLQKGLQTAHLVADLSLDSHMDSQVNKIFTEWAVRDRTIIILNGGNSLNLERWEQFLKDFNRRWPWVAFREDQQSLNGAITTVGLIIPDSVYLNQSDDSTDMLIYERLIQCQLAH